ncbi:hypothetical protein HDU93_002743 [Gonapodya sp. JEL0774]|nr:hypothetical protein HDU93_002743 [Gonapodya sp. JEL0774]
MLKARRVLKEGDSGDYLLSSIIESEDPNHLSLVAEWCDRVVGFMHLTNNAIDQVVLNDHDFSDFPTVAAAIKHSSAFLINIFAVEDAFAEEAGCFVRAAFDHFGMDKVCVISLSADAIDFPLLRQMTRVPSAQRANPGVARHVVYFTTARSLLPINLECTNKNANWTFAVKMERTEVGTVVIETNTRKGLSEHCDIEDFLSNENPSSKIANLLSFTLHDSISEGAVRCILEDVLSFSDHHALLWQADADDVIPKMERIAKREFFPVRRRRRIQFPSNSKDGEPPFPIIHQNIWILPVRLLQRPRRSVHSRIVFVGASDCGLTAALELCQDEHLNYTNVTMVSRVAPSSSLPEYFTQQQSFLREQLETQNLTQLLSVCEGDVCHIDRQRGVVKTKGGESIGYDLLALTTGQQYDLSSSLSEKLGALPNVCGLNKCDIKTIDQLLEYAESTHGKIIVYGSSLQSLTFLRDEEFQDAPSLDADALRRLKSVISKFPFTAIRGQLVYWEARNNSLTTIKVLSENGDELVVTDISSLFYSGSKTISPSTFQVINSACLSFDGKFGAGSGTKYQSKFNIRTSHDQYSSSEIGAKLANVIKGHTVNGRLASEVVEEEPWSGTLPKVLTAKLPGMSLFRMVLAKL